MQERANKKNYNGHHVKNLMKISTFDMVSSNTLIMVYCHFLSTNIGFAEITREKKLQGKRYIMFL